MTIGKVVEEDAYLTQIVKKDVIGIHGDGDLIKAIKIAVIGNGSKSNKANFIEDEQLFVALQNASKMQSMGFSRDDFDKMFENSANNQNKIALIKKINDEWIHESDVVAIGKSSQHKTKFIFKKKDELDEAPNLRKSKRKRATTSEKTIEPVTIPTVENAPAVRYNSASSPTTFKGFTYDSRMEARFAVFLTELNIPFKPQPRPGENYYGSTWTIDFQIFPDNPETMFFIEYKPNWPTYTELQKIEIMAHKYKKFIYTNAKGEHTRSVPCVLMYGEMKLPYNFGTSSSGLRGESFYYNQNEIVRETVIWTWIQNNAMLRHHSSTLDQTWCDEKLVKAYDAATSFVF